PTGPCSRAAMDRPRRRTSRRGMPGSPRESSSGAHLVIDAEARLAPPDVAPPGEPALANDLVLHAQQTFGERLGARRAAGHVDVDRDDLVDALAHRIGQLEQPAAVRAASHADDVFRLGHLFVEELAALGHLEGERAGVDHEVALAPSGAPEAAEA